MEYKNSHRMENGQTLRLERGWNNLNKRETASVNGWVISGEGIPEGAECLLNHNGTHETFRITNHGQLSGSIIAGKIEYYSVPEDNVYFWRKDSEKWNPIKGYVTGLRVFKPYTGILQGIDHSLIKNVLYITSGELSGQVIQTLRACDYEMIFQDLNGRENRVIRCRHYEDEDNEREEVVCLRNDYTAQLKKEQLLIGLTSTDAKPLKELAHA